MKKALSLILCVAMILSMTACGGGSTAQSGSAAATTTENKAVTLKLSDLNAETSQTGQWCQRIKELIEGAGVNLTVEYYPNGSLTGQDIEAVQAGICDMLQATAATAAGIWEPLGAFDAPYIMNNDEEAMKVFDYESEAMQYANENIAPIGVRLMGAFYSGARHVTTTSKPIYSIDDMKSLKLRVVNGELYIALFRAFGCEPTPMAFSEVSTALVTGVCEGQENPYSSWVTSNMYEIQSYGAETGHMPANYCMWMNENTFQKLSAEQQQVVIDSIRTASLERTQIIKEKEAEDKALCIEKGMTIIDESNGLQLDGFKEAAMTVYDTFADAWGDMPDKIRACY